MILSMECNCDSLAWLPGAHGVNEQLQRGEIPILDELDGDMVLKIPVGSIEKDASIRLVAGVELKQGHPDPIKTPEFSLQAAGIGRLANAWGFPADGLHNDCYRNIEFTRDSTRVQAACLRIEQGRFHSRKSMSSGCSMETATPMVMVGCMSETRRSRLIVCSMSSAKGLFLKG
jgi:hypothetical protein